MSRLGPMELARLVRKARLLGEFEARSGARAGWTAAERWAAINPFGEVRDEFDREWLFRAFEAALAEASPEPVPASSPSSPAREPESVWDGLARLLRRLRRR